MSNYKGQFVLLAIVIFTQTATCNHCPSPPPCSCSGRDIRCDAKHLTSVPALVGAPNTTYRLFLNDNPNLVITDDSLSNITLEYLNLDNDRNISISSNAFKNQIKTLKELHMSNTDLRFVPDGLRHWERRPTLHWESNEIQNWDLMLVWKLGLKLTKLDISKNKLTAWPRWHARMANLHWLDISYNTFVFIPYDAFDVFHLSLNYLDISETWISDMPTALHTLHELTDLHVERLSIDGNDVICTCHDEWFPNWVQTYTKNPDITGRCVNYDTYIHDFYPRCRNIIVG